MKNKKILSIIDQKNVSYLYAGIAWLICGVASLFDSTCFFIIEIIAMGGIAFTYLKVARAEKESEDEMSIKNFRKARYHTYSYMHIAFAIITIGCLLINFFAPEIASNINIFKILVPVFFISTGIEYILMAMLFRKFERDGEECIF